VAKAIGVGSGGIVRAVALRLYWSAPAAASRRLPARRCIDGDAAMCCLRPGGRGHKCPSNVTAVRPPASVNGGAAGNGPSVNSDADYRENQARAQRAWAQTHPDYWRDYRRTHPQYCESNRDASRRRQRERRQCAASLESARFAKMDASMPDSRVPSGTYRLVPAAAAEFAKMDAWMVEITLVSGAYGQAGEVCKERT
jgi:hypothetical protein